MIRHLYLTASGALTWGHFFAPNELSRTSLYCPLPTVSPNGPAAAYAREPIPPMTQGRAHPPFAHPRLGICPPVRNRAPFGQTPWRHSPAGPRADCPRPVFVIASPVAGGVQRCNAGDITRLNAQQRTHRPTRINIKYLLALMVNPPLSHILPTHGTAHYSDVMMRSLSRNYRHMNPSNTTRGMQLKCRILAYTSRLHGPPKQRPC